MDINPNKRKLENDLDLASFKKLLKILSENIKKGNISQPKFILYLGDLVGHLPTTTKGVIQDEIIVFSELKNNFPKAPIFYVFGNNDSLAIDYDPFSVNNLPKKRY
jgi:predicted MPP superfamily phosphohydrolase